MSSLYQKLIEKGFNKKSAEKLCMKYEANKKKKKATILSSQVFSGADAVVATQAEEEDKVKKYEKGSWKTIKGAHVHVDEAGNIDKGPKALKKEIKDKPKKISDIDYIPDKPYPKQLKPINDDPIDIDSVPKRVVEGRVKKAWNTLIEQLSKTYNNKELDDLIKSLDIPKTEEEMKKLGPKFMPLVEKIAKAKGK